MSSTISIGPRGQQILWMLFNHGPLLPTTLRAVIEPMMSKRKLNIAIARLRKLGLVRNRHSSTPKSSQRYIELTQKEPAKDVLVKVLKVSEDELKRIPGSTEALEHWQECVIWAKHFKTIFPNAQVFHDFQMWRSDKIREMLKIDKNEEIHTYPDLLIAFECNVGNYCTIAIEVERTQKSGSRIIRKLRGLAIASEIDGVLYICRGTHVADNVKRIYRTHVLPHAHRVERYADQFLLISDGSVDRDLGTIRTFDLKGSGINLVCWSMNLRRKKDDERAVKSSCMGAKHAP
ncbi:MAG: hypothetical protein JNL01_12900 [Bdellovibrionales bacterium]|nr:hypothetical protein [Bdellovibrionales bacterium]